MYRISLGVVGLFLSVLRGGEADCRAWRSGAGMPLRDLLRADAGECDEHVDVGVFGQHGS